MLILTRRIDETLMIGDDITVTVLGVKGNQVRLGVTAPNEVPVHREEIYLRIQQQQEVQRTCDHWLLQRAAGQRWITVEEINNYQDALLELHQYEIERSFDKWRLIPAHEDAQHAS